MLPVSVKVSTERLHNEHPSEVAGGWSKSQVTLCKRLVPYTLEQVASVNNRQFEINKDFFSTVSHSKQL